MIRCPRCQRPAEEHDFIGYDGAFWFICSFCDLRFHSDAYVKLSAKAEERPDDVERRAS